MNDDTVKLVRIPADTWRAVVGALEVAEAALQSQRLPTKRVANALALARKVSAE